MRVSMIIIFSRSWSSWRRSRVGRWYWPPSRLHIIPTPSMLSLSMIFYLTEVNIHIIHIIPTPSMLSLSIIFYRTQVNIHIIHIIPLLISMLSFWINKSTFTLSKCPQWSKLVFKSKVFFYYKCCSMIYFAEVFPEISLRILLGKNDDTRVRPLPTWLCS